MTGVPFLGSAGLLGSLVVKALIAADIKASAMDNTTSNVPYAFNVGFFISIANKILRGLATRLRSARFVSWPTYANLYP